MEAAKIHKIEDLFHIGNDKKIKKQEVRRLTAPGENYGSLILSVNLTVESSSGTEEIHSVVKMIPPNEFLQKIFNTKVTFRNEIAFYKKIVPTLQKFQMENGCPKIDFAPKYYGSRLNQQGEVDSNSALVLENLVFDNYVTLERTGGLDFDVSRLIMKDLAQIHAVPLALKLKKPDVFEKEIKLYLANFGMDLELHSDMKNGIICIIDQIDELKPLKETILKGFDNQMIPYEAREPFATFVHNDCWTNNAMIKYEGTKAVRSKIVDFQLCKYASPARDLVFFLFSSVKSQVLVEKYDELLKIYHGTFVKVLEDLKCDVSDFSYENLLKEIDYEARNTQFAHVASMMIPIFAVNEEVVDIVDLQPEDMAAVAKNVTDLHKRRFVFVVNEFMKRNCL